MFVNQTDLIFLTDAPTATIQQFTSPITESDNVTLPYETGSALQRHKIASK